MSVTKSHKKDLKRKKWREEGENKKLISSMIPKLFKSQIIRNWSIIID